MPAILIIDSDPSVGKYFRALLSGAGHSICYAADVVEALARAEVERPDLIIADILVTAIDGFESIGRFRANPALAHIPFVFCTTAYYGDEASRLADSLGVQVIIKPSDVETILRSVNHALAGQARSPAAEVREDDRQRLIIKVHQEAKEIEQIYRYAPVGLCLLDRDLRFVRINEQLAELTGKPMAAHIGCTIRQIIPEMADEIEQIHGRVLVFGEPVLDAEVHGLTASGPGGARDWSVNYCPLKSRDGAVFGVMAAVLEISDRKRAERQLADYATRLEEMSLSAMKAMEAERRRLGRELHDEIGQILTSIKINLQTIERASIDPRMTTPLEDGLGSVEQALHQVRDMALDLRPPLLDDLGLVPTLRWYLRRQTERSGLSIHLSVQPEEFQVAPELATACFRVVQEALNNIVKYAHAQSVHVLARKDEDEVCLTIDDDGVGFNVDAASASAATGRSLGLLNMQDRAHLLGGTCHISSEPGRGTKIELSLPLNEAAAKEKPELTLTAAAGPEYFGD